jgi:hypothetical protein
MADAAAKLAAEIADLRRRLAAVERSSQLGRSTIAVGDQDFAVPDALEAGSDALAGTSDLSDAQLVFSDFQDSIADAQQELAEASGELGERLWQAEDDLAASSARLDAAEAELIDAFGQLDAVDTKATDAANAASAAQTAADTAHTAATDAATAAANAAGIANGKGKALIQSTAPDTADRNAVTLWIDTTGGANTPKRWNGSAWVAVTDKAATDAATAAANAASAASAADTKAQQALTAAGSAQTTANSALTMAGSKGKVFYDTTTPSGTGTAVGDLWRQIDASKNVIAEWYWTGSLWQTSQITTSAISNLDVGKLTAGSATIISAVAQKIAASTASFQTADIANLFVGAATMSSAVAQAIYTAKLSAGKIMADEVLIGPGGNLASDPVFAGGFKTWTQGTGCSIVAGASSSGGNVYRMTVGTGYQTSYNNPQNLPTEASASYKVTARLKSSVALPANAVYVMLRHTTAAGTNTTTKLATPAITAGAWTTISGTIKVGSAAQTMDIAIEKASSFTTAGTIDWEYVSVVRATDASLVVDGLIDGQTVRGATIIGGELKTTETANAICARLGPITAYDPFTGGLKAGIGFQKIGATGSGPSMYSNDGQDLYIMQGGPNVDDGNLAYLSLGSDNASMFAYNTFTIQGGSGGLVNAGNGQLNLMGTPVTVNGNAVGLAELSYYEATGSKANFDAANQAIATPSYQSGSSTKNLATTSAGTITVTEAGIYSVTASLNLYSDSARTSLKAATGRSFIDIADASGAALSRTALPVGEDATTGNVAGIKLAAGAALKFNLIQTTGGTAYYRVRIWLTRIG